MILGERMMIEQMLIVDQGGIPFYSKKFKNSAHDVDPSLLGGLISAIDSMGAQLFQKKIATIKFGEESFHSAGESLSKIVFINKDLFHDDKHIFFVFFCSGDHSLKVLREITTSVFIEVKSFLRAPSSDMNKIQQKVDHILETRFQTILGLEGGSRRW